jgi:hypothetical protein
LERHHNERFTGLLNQHLLQWRTLREELNGSVLAEFQAHRMIPSITSISANQIAISHQ